MILQEIINIFESHMPFLQAQAIKYRALKTWCMGAQGTQVALAFADEILPLAGEIQGMQLIQLGDCGSNPWLASLRLREKRIVIPYLEKQNSIVASMTQLPLANQSVDCVVTPFLCEVFPRNKLVLSEVDRILKPMGYWILFGINPLSFWGVSLRMGHLKCVGNYPTKLTSSFKVKQWLLAHDYQQYYFNTFYYIPPVTHQKSIKKLAFLNQMGKMLILPAGFYCLIMQKYQADYLLEEKYVIEQAASSSVY